MSRYIDAEWLKAQVHNVVLANGALHGCVDKLCIYEAPSVDVVRCKDCKKLCDCRNDSWQTSVISMGYVGWCIRTARIGDVDYVKADDFCSYGERTDHE